MISTLPISTAQPCRVDHLYIANPHLRAGVIQAAAPAMIYLDRQQYALAIADADRAAELKQDSAPYQNARCWTRVVANRELDLARTAMYDAALKIALGVAAILRYWRGSRGLGRPQAIAGSATRKPGTTITRRRAGAAADPSSSMAAASPNWRLGRTAAGQAGLGDGAIESIRGCQNSTPTTASPPETQRLQRAKKPGAKEKPGAKRPAFLFSKPKKAIRSLPSAPWRRGTRPSSTP